MIEQTKQDEIETVSTMASSIAHDLNNIFAAIIGYAELALLDTPEISPLHLKLERILKAVDRGTYLAKQLFSLPRLSDQKPRSLDLKLIIREAIKSLRTDLPASIEIRDNIQVQSGMISGNPAQLHRVLRNLCTNAGNAMRDQDGVVKLDLTEVELDSDALSFYPNLRPGNYLKLTVNISVQGVDQSVMDRALDPLFTTRIPGEETYMGLSVVHRIVKEYGGTISVRSELGTGTTIEVLLPRIERRMKSIVDIMKSVHKTEARILLVDDEESIVSCAQQLLEHLGNQVVASTSSIEALEAFRSHPDKIDLVITDMSMPKMTGMDLSRELLQIRSDIPIILCTGFSEALNPEETRKLGIRETLMKPFLANDLAQAIGRVLPNKEK